MKKVILLLFAIALVWSPAWARFKTTAHVRHRTENGFSDWYDAQVTFLTGAELNEKTNSFKYDQYRGRYALFSLEDSTAGATESTVVKLSGSNYCLGAFSEACLPITGRTTGTDENGQSWEICTGMCS